MDLRPSRRAVEAGYPARRAIRRAGALRRAGAAAAASAMMWAASCSGGDACPSRLSGDVQPISDVRTSGVAPVAQPPGPGQVADPPQAPKPPEANPAAPLPRPTPARDDGMVRLPGEVGAATPPGLDGRSKPPETTQLVPAPGPLDPEPVRLAGRVAPTRPR